MNGNFDDIETTARRSAFLQERMSLVSGYMYKQFLEYRQSNANTAVLLDKIAENMALTVEFLKQSFNMRGIPTSNIYCEYNKQKFYGVINILWHTITFVADMNGSPRALRRPKELPSVITGRIFAIKGHVSELQQGFNSDLEEKLLSMEIASLFVPAEKTEKAIMKIRHLSQERLINQIDAPREFLMQVIEMVCGGGNYYNEGSINNII